MKKTIYIMLKRKEENKTKVKKNIQHIILVSIDTLRADCINASPRAKEYAKKYKIKTSLKTDVLDKILNSGLYYNNCFSVAPYTSAAHAAYFTGMWPLHNGVYEFFNRKLVKPTIFEYAKKMGYTTIFQTDFPIILGPYLGFTKGVDQYFIEDENKAFEALIRNKKKNTLSFFHFAGVHYPYGFHTLKFGRTDYENKILSLEKKYKIYNKEKHKPNDILDETFRNKKDTGLLLRYKYIIEKLYQNKMYDDLFELYLEGINYFLKNRFNKFISKVKTFVDKNNAILFLFSDHGEEWDANSEGHHNSLSDNVLRVPLVVYGKQINPDIRRDLVRTVDLAPTIINLLQYRAGNINMDGSVLDIFKSSKSKPTTKYAISQVWISLATKKQIADYQNATIKNKSVRPLKTYLSAEIVRMGDKKLAIHYKMDGTILKEKLAGAKNGFSDLRKILTKYNSLKKKKNNVISDIETKIRNELNNLGYRV